VNAPNVVGLDLSLSATGIALPDGTTLTIKPKPANLRGGARLSYLADRLDDLIKFSPLDLVVIEDYSPGAIGIAGKLANAGLAGALIVRDSSALVGLMDLLGFAQTYKYDTEGILQKSLPKFIARTLGSLIPNIAKELDAWTDPGLYRANAGWEYFMQQVPWVRREIPPGPAVDVFGDKISVERKPWSRWVKERKQDPEWTVLGDLASKGVFMPIPGPWKIENDDGTRRDPTPAEMQDYQKKVGAEYRTFIREQGADLLQMDPDEARKEIDRETAAIRKSVRADLAE